MKSDRICILCQTKYSFCPTCNSIDRVKPQWYFTFCGEACHEMFTVLSGYSLKSKTTEDVKNTMKKFNITDYSGYKESVKNQLNRILKEEIKEEKEEITNNVNNENQEEIAGLGIIENEVVEKSNEENFEEVKDIEEKVVAETTINKAKRKHKKFIKKEN